MGNITQYEYDANGRLIRTVKPDGSEELRTYNEAGQLIRLLNRTASGEVINDDHYVYDAYGNVIGESDTAYEYDALYRVVSSDDMQYEYDAAGNPCMGC